jgi:hypothetical protein
MTRITPRGTEIKPGVWAGENAQIHRKARVLAPSFVGANAKIRASAVLTRASVVEHHADIDCGTVVENTSVLPMSVIGAGLDLSHSVVGFRHIWNLKRDVEVEITDGKLVGALRSAPRRVLANAARLAFFLPKVATQAAFGRRPRPDPEITEAVRLPAAALKHHEEQPGEEPVTSDLISARRYGNE